MNLRLICALTLICMITSTALADNDPETPWPVEENCVAEPTQPPDDWTYSGTLLMSGYAGIHAVQADWETPRVVAFFHEDDLGKPIDGGQISPDGNWYAVPIGETFYEVSNNQYWITNGLRLYSTVDETELNFDLKEYDHLLDYNREGHFLTAWTYQAVRWIDNNTLIIGSFLVRPFDGVVEVAPVPVAEIGSSGFEVAADWSRVYGFIATGQGGAVIFDPKSPDEAIKYLRAEAVAWMHDSSGFIGEQRVETEEQLSLFDRDGEFIERLYVAKDGHLDTRRIVAGRNELGWSLDDRYFAFVHNPRDPRSAELVLLDMEKQIAVNSCLSPASQPVWSPDGMQIAMLLRAPENLRVVIFDLETWTGYDVARHSGIRGVLHPDMIAWRSGS